MVKHRVWNGERMIYDRIDEPISFGVSTAGIYTVEPNDDDTWNLVSRPSWRAMSFTGLRDRHGREVYAGDIVKYAYSRPWPVTFVNGAFGMALKDSHAAFYLMGTDDLEIVGNIFETPELLDTAVED